MTTTRDLETRDRLLATAARLFAAHGFAHVTVRDICEKARANVAAINYHFGGKTGLYDEVLKTAIRMMQGTTEEMKREGRGKSPEAQLEACVRVFLERVAGSGDSWIHQLMIQEMSNPTPALDRIADQVLVPRLAYIRKVVAAVAGLPPRDARVGHCLLSVQSQLVMALRQRMAARLQRIMPPQPDNLDVLASHIARFSIAGIKAIGK